VGCSPSIPKTDAAIESYLKSERKKFEKEIKLLLLGAGESGKSTVAKQMKIIHLGGFDVEERKSYVPIIFTNIIYNMKTLINAAFEMKIPIENEEFARKMLALDTVAAVDREVGRMVKALWAEPAVHSVIKRQNEIQLNDSAGYYFDAIDRIMQPDFIPNEQDVLRSRAKTTGIIETEFDLKDTKIKLVDVGGQRSERKKWMHCFQDVTAIIFCVAISEYDLKLYEDDKVNRMHESLDLFKQTINNEWFSGARGSAPAMIVFSNKSDLFREKIQKVDLKVCFPDYSGGCNFEAAYKYIEKQFVSANTNSKRSIYTHMTQATDTGNIQVVFTAVQDILLRGTLDEVYS